MSRYKSDGTTRDDNGPIILRPVSIADAKGVLNENSNDLGTLCKSTKINPWSRRKPIPLNKMTPLSESDFSNQHYGFNMGSSTAGAFQSIFKEIDKSNLFGHYTPNYIKPRGSSVTPNEPYRLTDFDSYNHNAPSLFEVDKTRTKYDNSLVDTWCYSIIVDALRVRDSNNWNVNALVNNTNGYLYPNVGNTYILKYTYNGQERIRSFQMSNTLTFTTLSNETTNPNPTDPLTLKEIGLDGAFSIYDNYSFAIIIKINGDSNYYLFNTKLTLSDLFTGGQSSTNKTSTIKYKNSGGVLTDLVLAQKTGNKLDINIYPWLLSEYVEKHTEGNNVYYSPTNNGRILNGVALGTAIDMKLCLTNAYSNNSDWSSFFYKINQNTDTLYSCEFKYNVNTKTVYYYNLPASTRPSNTYWEIKNAPGIGNSGQVIYNTLSSSSYTVDNGWYDIIRVLYYVKNVGLYASYWLYSLNTPSPQQADPYSAFGEYQTYSLNPKGTSHSNPSLSFEIEYKMLIYSPFGYRYVDSNNNVITNGVNIDPINYSYDVVNFDGGSSTTFTVKISAGELTHFGGATDAQYASLGNPTDIIYKTNGDVELNKNLYINTNSLYLKSLNINYGTGTSGLNNFKNSYADITIRALGLIDASTGRNYEIKLGKKYFYEIFNLTAP